MGHTLVNQQENKRRELWHMTAWPLACQVAHKLTLETIYNKQHGKIYYAVEGSTSMASRVDHSWVWSLLYCLFADIDNSSWPIVITAMNELLVQLSASCLCFNRHGKGLMTVNACCWLYLSRESLASSL